MVTCVQLAVPEAKPIQFWRKSYLVGRRALSKTVIENQKFIGLSASLSQEFLEFLRSPR